MLSIPLAAALSENLGHRSSALAELTYTTGLVRIASKHGPSSAAYWKESISSTNSDEAPPVTMTPCSSRATPPMSAWETPDTASSAVRLQVAKRLRRDSATVDWSSK